MYVSISGSSTRLTPEVADLTYTNALKLEQFASQLCYVHRTLSLLQLMDVLLHVIQPGAVSVVFPSARLTVSNVNPTNQGTVCYCSAKLLCYHCDLCVQDCIQLTYFL